MVMALIVIFAIILILAVMNIGKPSGENLSDPGENRVQPIADTKSAKSNGRTEMRNRLNERLCETIDEQAEKEGLSLSINEKDEIRSALIDEMLGFGPIQKFLDDGDISEIYVLSHDQITVTRNGHTEKTGVKFNNAEHLNNIIERVTEPLGIRVCRADPVAKVVLPGGHETEIDLFGSEKSSPIIKITKS